MFRFRFRFLNHFQNLLHLILELIVFLVEFLMSIICPNADKVGFAIRCNTVCNTFVFYLRTLLLIIWISISSGLGFPIRPFLFLVFWFSTRLMKDLLLAITYQLNCLSCCKTRKKKTVTRQWFYNQDLSFHSNIHIIMTLSKAYPYLNLYI